MGYAIGIALALVVPCFARLTGLDRDRAFYPTVLVIVASYYVLFAVIGASTGTLLVELLLMSAFVLVAVIGFKFNLWLIVAALAAHGVLDAFHHLLTTNPGVPGWWPEFCLGFDVGAAAFLAWLLMRARIPARG